MLELTSKTLLSLIERLTLQDRCTATVPKYRCDLKKLCRFAREAIQDKKTQNSFKEHLLQQGYARPA